MPASSVRPAWRAKLIGHRRPFRCPDRRNRGPSGEATEQWDVLRYGKGAGLLAVAASPLGSPPTPPGARRQSSRATGSCCPLPRRRASLSSKSRRLSILAADSKRCASCPRGVQPRECRGSQPSHCSGAGRPAVPHEVVGDEDPAPFEGARQHHFPALADQR